MRPSIHRSSNTAVLAVEGPAAEEDLTLEAQAFAATKADKNRVMICDGVGGGALEKKIEQYLAHSAATCNMMPDADGRTNYRKRSQPLGLATGGKISVAGYGDLTVDLRTDRGLVRVELGSPRCCCTHNLFSLPSMPLQGCTYVGDKDGVTLKLGGGETIFFLLVGKLHR